MEERVVVTGLGPVCAVGVGKDEFWNGIVSGRSGVGKVTLVPEKEQSLAQSPHVQHRQIPLVMLVDLFNAAKPMSCLPAAVKLQLLHCVWQGLLLLELFLHVMTIQHGQVGHLIVTVMALLWAKVALS